MKVKVRRDTGDRVDMHSGRSEIDSGLASLFASSAGPVSIPKRTEPKDPSARRVSHASPRAKSDIATGSVDGTTGSKEASPNAETNGLASNSRRKRKSTPRDEEIEDAYFRRLSRDAENNEAHGIESQPRKRLRVEPSISADPVGNDQNMESKISENHDSSDAEENDSLLTDDTGNSVEEPLIHESLVPDRVNSEIEKASRTVFLGNVSSLAITSKPAYRQLIAHISTVLQSPSLTGGMHKIESLRFRSTAYASSAPKKGAFAKKELMDATTKSTNAYVVYTSQSAAREAAKTLNGTVILDRHLRADLAAHPAKIDHRRCVFVGNLGFVDDESSINAADDADDDREGRKTRKSNKQEPGDVEEGLWREFEKAGMVESVRVVRDPKTRVGKGFAYVQFTDENAVEAAILFDGKKFPPLLPRKLRVSRAKSVKRNAPSKSFPQRGGLENKKTTGPSRNKSLKINPQKQSLAGRAGKLIGRAGAAAVKSEFLRSRAVYGQDAGPKSRMSGDESARIKTPENFVFEGHRARSNQRPSGLKLSGKGKKKGKSQKIGRPKTRSAKRAAAWKAHGSKRS